MAKKKRQVIAYALLFFLIIPVLFAEANSKKHKNYQAFLQPTAEEKTAFLSTGPTCTHTSAEVQPTIKKTASNTGKNSCVSGRTVRQKRIGPSETKFSGRERVKKPTDKLTRKRHRSTRPAIYQSETSLAGDRESTVSHLRSTTGSKILPRSQSDSQIYRCSASPISGALHLVSPYLQSHVQSIETSSPGLTLSGPSYEVFFVENDKELDALTQQLLIQIIREEQDCFLQQHTRQQRVLSIIQGLEDLHLDDLAQEVTITSSGSFAKRDGLIFGDTPVTLLIDFRNFLPEQIPELNELFEQPARFQGKLLKNNVRIIAVINESMLPWRCSMENVPGSDFWWRINNASPPKSACEYMEQWQQSTQAAGLMSPQEWVNQTIPELERDNDSTGEAGSDICVIDFTGKEWRNLLFGTPDVDENSHLIYRHGALEGLSPNQHLVFKNAPWYDIAFVVRMFHIFQTSQFRSNGALIPLPANLKLSRQSLTQKEIQNMASQIHWLTPDTSGAKPKAIACINRENFSILMQETILTEQGTICRAEGQIAWLQGVDCIRVTSSLTESQWLQLIWRLQEAKLLYLPIYTDVADEQPSFIKSVAPRGDKPAQWSDHSDCKVKIELYETGNTQIPLTSFIGTEPAEEFVILPEQSLTKITRNIRILSLKQRLFSCQVTRLIKLLREGKHVYLSGLQSNPVLLQQMESLLCHPPYLMIFGKREEFPDMKLSISWPKDKVMPSPVWQSCLEATASQQDKAEETGKSSRFLMQFSFDNLKHLYGVMGNLIGATYCPEFPPADFDSVFVKVVRQAECEKELDGCTELQSYHVYKAICSTVLKEYRGNAEVYFYLKNLCARLFFHNNNKRKDCQESTAWIDREYLLDWLQEHPVFDRNLVKEQFWSLAMAFPADTFHARQIPAEEDITSLTAHLAVLACGDDQSALQRHQEYAGLDQSSVATAQKEQKNCSQHSRRREKQFYDLLTSLDSSQRQSGSVHQQARLLTEAALQGKASLGRAVADVVTRPAQSNKELTSRFFSDSPNWQTWEERRIKRLEEKVRKHPIVFIKGETGAGKSYIAETVARRLNPDISPMIITVGPETELSDLLGRITLSPDDHATEDSKYKQCVTEQGKDHQALSIPAPLKQWAMQRSDRPIIIIIDEANLSIPELWNCLKGLFQTPPCLYSHGDKIFLTPQHRIIMTGNLDHFSGRRMNELLRIHAPQLFYPLLNPAFVHEKILTTGLIEILKPLPFSDEMDKNKTLDYLMQTITLLYKTYPLLLPERVFTPRDLTDIFSRINVYLSAYRGAYPPSEEGLNGLGWQAMDETLGGEIAEDRQRDKRALQDWYQARKPMDNSLTLDHLEAFEKFYQDWILKQNQDANPGLRLNCSNKSVYTLMKRIWLEQQRSQKEHFFNATHRGRHATIIVGPPGRGKSVLLGQLLHFMCQQANLPPPHQINAGRYSWVLLQQAVIEARREGRVLIISEPNLLKSEELEGFMNSTVQAAHGFHIYLTANPSSFIGRHRFSPALKNRFTCISITEYTDEDIQAIARTIFAGQLTDKQRKQVVEWHLMLLHHLKQKHIPLRPSVGDLQKLADMLKKQEFSCSSATEQLVEAFQKQYNLFLTTSQCSLQNLAALQSVTPDTAEKNLDYLSQALNSSLSLTTPVVLETSTQTNDLYVSPSQHIEIPQAWLDFGQPVEDQTIPDKNTLANTTLDKATLALALAKWKEKSGTEQCPYEYDTLYSTCFRLWQQHFIKETFSLPPALLPLSKEQQATLNHPGNKKMLDKVQQVIQQTPSPRGLELLWEKLSPHTQHTHSTQHTVSKPPTKHTVGKPPTKNAIRFKIDGLTAHQPKNFHLDQTFKDINPSYQRIKVMELFIDGDRILIAPISAGQAGYDVIQPLPLKEPVYTMGLEHYGVCKRKLDLKNYVELPGLYPHQTISQLGTDPPIPLNQLDIIRDRKTGHVLVRLKQAPAGYPFGEIKLHYILRKVNIPFVLPDVDDLPDRPSPFSRVVNQALEESSVFYKPGALALKQALLTWGKNFTSGPDITRSDDIEILKEVIQKQRGSCRHRCWAVYAIASARNMPVRFIISDSHAWLECSPNQGRSWQILDFGGSEGNTFSINKPDFKESAQGLVLSGEDREKLLNEAMKDSDAFARMMGMTKDDAVAWIESKGEFPLEISELSKVFLIKLKSSAPHDFRIALTMLTSGMCVLYQSNANLESFSYGLAKSTSQQILLCQTPEERETIFELLYSIKHLFSTKEINTTNDYWFLIIRSVSKCLLNHFYKNRDMKTFFCPLMFEMMAYCILRKDLLNQLTDKQCDYFYHHFYFTCEPIPEQYQKTRQKLHEKYKQRYRHYFSSIKAPAVQVPPFLQTQQTVPQNIQLLQGSSPSLEKKVRTTCIGTGFTWQPEGEVVVERFLRQQPPFREQKAVAGTRPVKILQTQANMLSPRSSLFRYIYDKMFSLSYHTLYQIPDITRERFSKDEEKIFERYVDDFCNDPSIKYAECIFQFFNDREVKIPEYFPKEINAFIENRKAVDNIIEHLPSSFAHYFAQLTKAGSGNLWLYHIFQDERYRGFTKPENGLSLLKADTSQQAFLSIPNHLICDHMKEDDGNSLFISPYCLYDYMCEFAYNIKSDDI